MMLGAVAIAGALALSVGGIACAQDAAYPSRAVRLIVAGAPGGNPDVLARLVAQRLTEGLGKPFVVETIPGSNGVLAARAITASAPDGHTLILGESAMMAINPALMSDLPYRPLVDFAPVTGLVAVPTVLVVPPSLGVRTLGEFISLARSRPGVLNYGSGGPGSIPDTPTAAELGLNGFDLATTIGLLAPAGIPPAIVVRLQDAVMRAMRDPMVIERMAGLGMEIRVRGTEEYAGFIKSDLERFGAVVRELGLQIK